MNEKSKENFAKTVQTHPSLIRYCFHIVSVTDFIQTLNKTEDFELLILYSHIFAFFYHFWDITILFLCHFCSSSGFIMGVYCGIFSRLEWVKCNLKISETTPNESHNFDKITQQTSENSRKLCDGSCDISLEAVRL